MTYGPADLYVVEFPASSIPSAVTKTLRDVAGAGVITLLDVALIRTADDGTRQVLELVDFAEELGLADLLPQATGLIGIDDITDLAGDLAPGSATLVVLMENTWARTITQAVHDADARVVAVERFPAEVVNDVAALASDGKDD